MQTANLLAAALLSFTSLPFVAQQADAIAQPASAEIAAANVSPTLNAPASASSTARGYALAVERMRPVKAELEGRLDTKSAKTGDPVELKTKEPVTTYDGTEIPKGTKILGHVTSVQAHGKTNADATVTIQLDRAELKGGKTLAILSEIRWVAPPPPVNTSSFLQSQDNIGGGVMGGATQVMGGAHNGGLGSGSSGGMTTSGGMVQQTPKQSEGLSSVADYGVQAPPTSAAGPVLGTVSRVTAHPTGVSGVMLSRDVGGKTSGTLSATGQNVHLDGGSQLVLAVAAVKLPSAQ